jgi:hypothetical protein
MTLLHEAEDCEMSNISVRSNAAGQYEVLDDKPA